MLLPLLLPLLFTHASAFLLLAQPLLLARLDPIVQPGIVSQHAHAVVGGSAFQPNYDGPTFAAARCTTMQVTVDKSDYWSPAVFGRNGNGTYEPLALREVRAYYLLQGNESVTAFPNGLKMVAGNAMSLNASGNTYDGSAYARFDCQQGDDTDPTNGLAMRGFPPYACQGFLRASIPFGNCWDGRNLDSQDHYAHMAYAGNGGGGSCPDTHPVRFPQLIVELGWESSAYPADALILANGDTTGYSLHADFAMGWNRTILSSALADPTCQHRENLYGSGAQCATLLPYLNSASGSCTLEGRIPQESVGLGFGPALPQLPGCNLSWSSGDRPACREPDLVGIGAPTGFVDWSGASVPVWQGKASGAGKGRGKGHRRMLRSRAVAKRRAHFVAGAATVAAVAAL
ncbi:hypothetical protein CALVIDRAFT_559298 [Calocera viscosa TUFC12733]|uniref:DUF1996 domain-containing protein n=1 Tax=Calocera viscosa (strain TUFC12733) TaxID=1330018 RepID=A0A167S197_CALVF|nr:hypothetical protein CALVIDRAFT_559298 [Calocera viscosa TUFC12733]